MLRLVLTRILPLVLVPLPLVGLAYLFLEIESAVRIGVLGSVVVWIAMPAALVDLCNANEHLRPDPREIPGSQHARLVALILVLLLAGFGTLDFPEFGLVIPPLVSLACWHVAGALLSVIASLLALEQLAKSKPGPG